MKYTVTATEVMIAIIVMNIVTTEIAIRIIIMSATV